MKSLQQFPGAGKFFDRMFRKVDNVVWDLMTGKIGVSTSDGIAVLTGDGPDDYRVEKNLMDEFGVALPAFAQSTPAGDVKPGDIIFRNEKDSSIAWIIEITAKGGFKLMKPSGEVTNWVPPKMSVYGLESGIMVVRSLMSMVGGGNNLQGMQGMMLPMLMANGGDMDFDSIMPMMLWGNVMNQPAADGQVQNNGMQSMMQNMMMMNMMKSMMSKPDGREKTPGRRLGASSTSYQDNNNPFYSGGRD